MDTAELASGLRQIVSSLHKGLRKQISDVSTFSMTELETIGHLFRNDSLLPTELAQLNKVKTQTMSQILSKLEQHKIIKRKASKQDKRKVYISLSNSGKKLVEKVKYERDAWLKEHIESTLTGKEIRQLQKVLPILTKLMDY